MGNWWNGLRRWLVRWLSDAPTAAAREDARPTVLVLHHAREWTARDQMVWVSFLGTEAGRCLMQRLNAWAAQVAKEGCQDVMHPTHSAGRTAGIYDTIRWLESMTAIEFEQQIKISGASADQDATSAQEPQGEASLREQWSP